ncbi:GNAT family N-acetyltransferase [Virgibacillus siamensis]|uniref:GNAT family N-acetyltransferase n=1 Tax=Virgibacillus siamensis TaxID=480071 RepID=UPI00098717D9|nr:GNAT family N-acetyltransferase [Virgibacillus siamensis]
MNITLQNGMSLQVRKYRETDFETIQHLNAVEGWNNLVEKKMDTMRAWNNSNIAYLVLDGDQIIGYIRGMTDTAVTLFICEVIIEKEYRGQGIGQKLLAFIHSLYPSTRMELLAASSSQSFYKQLDYRPFYGYRKTFAEWNATEKN